MKKLFLLVAVIMLAVPAVANATWEHDKCRNLEPVIAPAAVAPQPVLLPFAGK